MEKDIRWEQRFSNFEKALEKLKQSVNYINQTVIDEQQPIKDDGLGFVKGEMIKEGLILRFEYTPEF